MLFKIIFISLIIRILFKLGIMLNYSLLERHKISEIECGLEGRIGFSGFMFKYYMITLIFLIFDIELGLLWPVSREGYKLGDRGFIFIILFIIVLTIGFIYEIKEKII